MAVLTGGRGELNDAAAASIHRIDRQIGHLLQITEARRQMWLQEQYWDEYQEYLDGGPWAPIAAYPSPDAPHIRNGGEAIDTDERITEVLNEHGWFHTVYDADGNLEEPWHYEYFIDRDQHRNDPTPTTQEDTDMSMNTFRHPNGTIFFIDEMGADHLGDYKTADIGLGEFIQTAADAFGAPVQVNERQFDITVAIANRRWEAKKNEIIAGVVKALQE